MDGWMDEWMDDGRMNVEQKMDGQSILYLVHQEEQSS